MTSTKARSLEYARKQGWLAGDVERWVPNPKHPAGGQRRDLWGFCDLIVIDGFEHDLRFVNAVGSGEVNKHLTKWKEDDESNDAIRALIDLSISVEIWVWRKLIRRDARGAKRKMWSVKIHTLESDGEEIWVESSKEGQ